MNDVADGGHFFVLCWFSQLPIFHFLKAMHVYGGSANQNVSHNLLILIYLSFFFFFNAVLTVFVSLSSILSLSLCRNPMCRTVTAKWLASSRTHWAGTVAPPCSSVALPPATMMQKPNPPWCLANGKLLPCSGATGCCTVQHNTHPCLTQLQLFSWNVLNLGCAHILLSLTRLLMTCNLLWRQVLVSDGAEIA